MAQLQITPGRTTTVSVPSPFGAVILKAAAYHTDSRDKERHLQDAALLLAVIEDPYAEREPFTGSDGSRIQTLVRGLAGPGSRVAPARRRLAREWAGGASNPQRMIDGLSADGHAVAVETLLIALQVTRG